MSRTSRCVLAVLGAVLLASVAPPRVEAAAPGARSVWTRNPGLVRDAGGWWVRAWRWNGFTGQTWEPVTPSAATSATWGRDGDVHLAALDAFPWDFVNDAASVTQQGPPLDLGSVTSLGLTARLGGYGVTPSSLAAWSGVKLDVWLRDTVRGGRLLYVEMYVARNGVNDLWCADFLHLEQDCRNELVRVLHEQHAWNTVGALDDYMVNLPAFEGTTCTQACLPALARRTELPDGSTRFDVDLLALVRRGAAYLGRSPAGLELIIAGVTVESGVILFGSAGASHADVNGIAVTYRV